MELLPGDIFFIPKGLSYQSYWSAGASWDSFRFDLFPAVDERQYSLQKLPCGADELSLIDEIAQIGTADTLAVGLLFTLFGKLQPRMKFSAASPHSVLLHRALIYMEQNPFCTVPMIADACSVSVSGLYGLFRRTLGRTPTEQKHLLLCERAAALLTTTELSVEEISERLGFSSSSYFRKVLFSVTGKTPSAIRKSAQLI